jgi:hypothetical protein
MMSPGGRYYPGVNHYSRGPTFGAFFMEDIMKRKFTEQEIQEIIENKNYIEYIQGQDRRYFRTNIAIFVDDEDRYFRIHWEEGILKNQKNEYPKQEAPEVKPIDKIIFRTEWVLVEK